MVNRINLLLQAKNITARQFAEEIGIQPSGMSHILSGRNNPSLDFVMKVVRRYPEIDINWLMFGKGEMYEAGKGVTAATPSDSSNETDSVSGASGTVSSYIPSHDKMGGQQTMFETAERNLFSEPPQSSKAQVAENGVKQYGNAQEFTETNLEREQTPSNSVPAKPQRVIEPEQKPVQIGGYEATLPRNVESEQSSQPVNGVQLPESSVKETVNVPMGIPTPKGKRIVRLLAFYDDHTFGEYFPE